MRQALAINDFASNTKTHNYTNYTSQPNLVKLTKIILFNYENYNPVTLRIDYTVFIYLFSY